MAREVYPSEAFKKQSKYFVFVKINTEQQPSVASAYQVTALPTIDVMTPDGTVVHQFKGFRPVNEFIAELDRARQMAGN